MMNEFSTISNEDKFALYASLYLSMGFDITYLNGNFGKSNILRTFSLQDFFEYYDNEIVSANIGIRNSGYWIIFECIANCSPIFKIDVIKNGIEKRYKAISVNNSNCSFDKKDSFLTAISCSNYFNFKNSFYLQSNAQIRDWKWWNNLCICEYKDIESGKIIYKIIHKDELRLLEVRNDNCDLRQYNFVQLFKEPISYFRKRNHLTDSYEKIVYRSFFWSIATGIGVISGGNTYRCIDVDGCSSIDFIKKILIE
ncbi:hypothetical protein FACS189441_8370 [Betaproteobacteria bacterium]|nr:hypothetical protein FACS189441_8370 [Betaproteobacteria bacterium]